MPEKKRKEKKTSKKKSIFKNKQVISMGLTVLILLLLIFASVPKTVYVEFRAKNKVGYAINLTQAVLYDKEGNTCQRTDTTTAVEYGQEVYLNFRCNAEIIDKKDQAEKRINIRISFERLNKEDTTPATGKLELGRK